MKLDRKVSDVQRRVRATCVVIGVAGALACAPPWREVTSQAGGFTVSMPGSPSVRTYAPNGQQWAGGELKVDTSVGLLNFFSKTRIIYWARYEDIPDGWDAASVVRRYEDLRKTGLPEGISLKRTEVGDIGRLGVQFVAEDKDVRLVAHVYVIRSRAYMLEVMGGPDNMTQADVDRFIASFRLN